MKSHRVWLLGDDIDTDVLAPGAFMKGSIEELSKHCLEAVEPGFAENVKTGDVIVAGKILALAHLENRQRWSSSYWE